MWIDTALPLLRTIIQDVSNTPDYGDSRLIDVLFSASHLLLSEVSFNFSYTVDIIARTIDPDPATSLDTSFLNMVVYKAALLILSSELKTGASQGVIVRDGPSTVDLRSTFASQKERYKLMLDEYNRVKMQIKLGDLNSGIGILGPYTANAPTYIWR